MRVSRKSDLDEERIEHRKVEARRKLREKYPQLVLALKILLGVLLLGGAAWALSRLIGG
jgi:hypothetical protein